MPRFGKQFKVYDRILPSQLLDVTDVIENCESIFKVVVGVGGGCGSGLKK